MGQSQSQTEDARTTAKIGRVDQRLQARLRRGVDVNVKVLVRGSRKVGKSTLILRLTGQKPKSFETYNATREISVSNVHWRNRLTEEIVKVEAWDVVDVALSSPSDSQRDKIGLDTLAGLPWEDKVEQSRQKRHGSHVLELLDSSNVDVNRNAFGVLVLYDPRDPATFDRALEIAEETPQEIALLFLRNFYDLVQADPDVVTVSKEKVQDALGKLQSQQRRIVHHMECSLNTSHGLQILYQYFSVPFLLAKLACLREQVHTSEENLDKMLVGIEEQIANQASPSQEPTESQLKLAFHSETMHPPEKKKEEREVAETCAPEDLVGLSLQASEKDLDAFFQDVDSEDEDQAAHVKKKQTNRRILKDYIISSSS